MTVREFLEEYNCVAFDLEEVAEKVCDITDDEKLSTAAKVFLEAKENFEMMLDNIGFELG